MSLTLTTHPNFRPDHGVISAGSVSVALPTAVGDPSAYAFSVAVTANQSVVGFPKFGTIGIGFEKETDWNSNLPYWVPAEEIADHIAHNRLAGGDETVARDVVVQAIHLIRQGAGGLPQYGIKCRACRAAGDELWRAHLRAGGKAGYDTWAAAHGPDRDLPPHWAEDCPRYDSRRGSYISKPAERDADGWPVDEDDEADA